MKKTVDSHSSPHYRKNLGTRCRIKNMVPLKKTQGILSAWQKVVKGKILSPDKVSTSFSFK